MLPDPPREQLALPLVPAPPPRAGFPLVATLAPVLVSVGIWAFTGSLYSLLFAALGPVVAIGGLFDGRRQRRRTALRDTGRTLAAFAQLSVRVDALHRRELLRRELLAPAPLAAVTVAAERWAASAGERPQAVRIGRVDDDAIVVFGEQRVDPEAALAIRDAASAILGAAAFLRGAIGLADARDGIGIVAPAVLGAAVARSIAFQLVAACSPETTSLSAPSGETWVDALPHVTDRSPAGVSEGRVKSSAPGPATLSRERSYRIRADDLEVRVEWATSAADLPPGLAVRIELDALAPAPSAVDAPARLVPEALGAVRAEELARALADIAFDRGLIVAGRGLPESVRLSDLLAEPLAPPASGSSATPGGLSAPIGMGRSGAVELDLVRDGPHAVIAGTTGTGKSELLVSWVLAMAARHPPSVVTFLLIDFKGGAAFTPLAELPHVAGIVTDLDAARSRRAIESLRAELRRRERLLAERGVRSIDELVDGLARLVIVVDEFAAVVSGQPELHEVFADLAARGRSLGLHLVLCTQRPSGVIRDGVLANVTMRISLRVTDRSDSLAMLGSDLAFALPSSPRGRAVIADGSGSVREVQLALAEPADALLIVTRWSGEQREAGERSAGERVAPVWCDPLPSLLTLGSLERDPEWASVRGIPFGRLDLPAEQRQPLAVHDPLRDGHLLVLGAARSGRSTTLAAFAADPRCQVMPTHPADAWTVFGELLRRPTDSRPLVLLIDDLDVLIDRLDPDTRHELVEQLGRLAREARDIGLIVSAQRLTGPLQRLAGLFDNRLLLRQPSRDEHVLAGGDAAQFDPRLPPGAGIWRGGSDIAATVQVAIAALPFPTPLPPELERITATAGTALPIVAGRPRDLLRAARAVGPSIRVVHLGDEEAPETELLRTSGETPLVLLGDPEAWQAEWALLGAVRRELPMVFVGCTAAEFRSLARTRDQPPPLGDRPGECWVVEIGDVRRAILEW